ncbi:hypothetical protein L3Y34_013666 [Caenorhabditis briggsae]|uniref:Uncharacterized protein n=1 Tax=Caenorhabditis briggsae TaxID=6238 RepID=A0AAE9CWK1_CAEBR|nr:hypothetical protein L3Y34_013666 [Caenorhabditis briggsae]
MPFVPQHIVKPVYPPSNSSANMNKLQLNLTDTSTMNHYLAGIAIKYSLDEDDNEIQVLQHIEKKSTDGPEHYSSIFNQPGNGGDGTPQYQRSDPKMKKCGSKQANIKKWKMCRETKCTCREVHNRTLGRQKDDYKYELKLLRRANNGRTTNPRQHKLGSNGHQPSFSSDLTTQGGSNSRQPHEQEIEKSGESNSVFGGSCTGPPGASTPLMQNSSSFPIPSSLFNNQAHHGSLGTQQVRIPGLLGSIYLPSPGVIERAMDPIYRQSSSISLSHVPSLLELGLPGAQDIRVSYQVSNPVGVSSGNIGILPNDKMEQTMDRRSLQDNIVQKKPFSNPEKHQPATDQISQSQSGPVSTQNSALKNCYETEKKLITVRPAGMSYENYREALFDQFDEMRLAKKKICLRFLNEPIYGAGISVPQKPKILFGSAMKTETVPLFEPSNLPSHLLPVAKSAEYVSSSAQQRLKHCEEAMYGQWDKTKTESDCSCESKKKLISTGQRQCRVASTP